MEFGIECCKNCGKKYEVYEINTLGVDDDLSPLHCPWCGIEVRPEWKNAHFDRRIKKAE